MNYVYLIVLNYVNYEDTIECIESILCNTYKYYKIVIIDNCSPNDSVNKILEWSESDSFSNLPKWLNQKETLIRSADKTIQLVDGSSDKKIMKEGKIALIKSSYNGGFAAGNNIGLKYSLSQSDIDFVWILNNDTVLKKNGIQDVVENVRDCLKKRKDIGIFGTKELYYDPTSRVRLSYFKYDKVLSRVIPKVFNEKRPIFLSIENNFPSGASIIMTPEFLDEVGLLDEDYFLYFEELDICNRAKKFNYVLTVLNNCEIIHKEGSSIGSSRKGKSRSVLSDYYGLRNRIKFTRKHFPAYLVIVYLSFVIVLINRILRFQFDRIPIVLKALIKG